MLDKYISVVSLATSLALYTAVNLRAQIAQLSHTREAMPGGTIVVSFAYRAATLAHRGPAGSRASRTAGWRPATSGQSAERCLMRVSGSAIHPAVERAPQHRQADDDEGQGRRLGNGRDPIGTGGDAARDAVGAEQSPGEIVAVKEHLEDAVMDPGLKPNGLARTEGCREKEIVHAEGHHGVPGVESVAEQRGKGAVVVSKTLSSSRHQRARDRQCRRSNPAVTGDAAERPRSAACRRTRP